MTHDNKLQVEAIKRGTVIDHIPAQVGFKLTVPRLMASTWSLLSCVIVVSPYRANSRFRTSASNAWRAKMPFPACWKYQAGGGLSTSLIFCI